MRKLDTQSLWLFFAVFILVLTLVGSQLVRLYGNSLVLSIMIILVCLLPILVAFDKIPKRYLPVLLFVAALSLLYCIPLSTEYLWGADSHQEYYFANLALTSNHWVSTIPNSFNAMLSITIFAPVLSICSGLPLILVFKIVFPIIFASISVILFLVFKTQMDYKTSFLSVFFFISLFTFYTEMIGLARQQIAEVYLALIFLLILSKNRHAATPKFYLLLVIFGVGLVLSHYTLAYIFIGSAIFVLIISYFRKQRVTLRPFYVALFVVVALSWYIYTAGSVIFNRFSFLLFNVFQSMYNELLNPNVVQPIHILLAGKVSVLHEVTKYLNIFGVGVIAAGFLGVLLGKIGKKVSREFVYFASANFFLCFFAFVAPYVASSLNTTRLYHISLIVLAPFFIFGFVLICRFFSRIRKVKVSRFSNKGFPLKLVAVLLAVFLLFNTGFMYQVTNTGTSILNPTWALTNGSTRDRVTLYNSYVPVEEVASAVWVKTYRNSSFEVYSDYRSRNNALNAYAMIPRDEGTLVYLELESINASSLVYLRTLNVVDQLFEGARDETGVVKLYNATEVTDALANNADAIYSDGGSIVYYTPSEISLSDSK